MKASFHFEMILDIKSSKSCTSLLKIKDEMIHSSLLIVGKYI